MFQNETRFALLIPVALKAVIKSAAVFFLSPAIFFPSASAQPPAPSPPAAAEAGQAAITTTGRLQQTHSLTFDNAGDAQPITLETKGSQCLNNYNFPTKIIVPAWQVTNGTVDDNNHIGGCSDQKKEILWALSASDFGPFDIRWQHARPYQSAFMTRVEMAENDIASLAEKGITVTAFCVDGTTTTELLPCLNAWTYTDSDSVPGVTIKFERK